VTPTCPPHYTCTFSPKNPPHYWTHWYDGPWGIALAAAAIVALTIIVLTVVYYIKEHRSAKLDYQRRERERQNALAIEEQRTMQIDSAKGNVEMLRLVKEMQRR
jgi:hypothetical protein